MTLQNRIRDRERGLRGPGLPAEQQAAFEEQVSTATALVNSAVGTRQTETIVDGQSAFRRLSDSDAIAIATDMLGANVYGLGVSKQVLENGVLTALDTALQVVSGTVATIRATVYRLPDDLISYAPDYNPASYTQIGQIVTAAASVLGSRRIAADRILARVPLPAVPVVKGQKLLITVEFLSGGGAQLQINMAFGDVGGGEESWLRGLYRNSTAWAALAPGGRAWARLVVGGPAELPTHGLGVTAVQNAHVRPALTNRWNGVDNWRAAGGFKEWAFRFTPARIVAPASIAPIIYDANLADSIFYRVYRRPVAIISTSPPGNHPADELLIADTIPIAALVDDATSAGVQEMRLPLIGAGLLDPGYDHYVNWSAVNGAGLGLAIGDNRATEGDDDGTSWYAVNSNPRLPVSPIGQSAAFTLYETAPTPDFARLPVVETVRGLDAPARVAGNNLVIDGLELARQGGALSIPRTTLTLTPIAQETLTEAKTVDPAARHGNAVYLGRKYVSDVVVTRVSDNVVLTAGTHYALTAATGLLEFTNTAFPSYPTAFGVSVAYKGYKRRYDLIHADPVNGAVAIAHGAARGTDPEEYLPALPSGRVALYHLLIVPGGAEIIPVHRYRNLMQIGAEAEFLAIREHNRRCLSPLAKLMRAGTAFGLLGYGDSQTEIGSTAEAQAQLVANTGRDGLAYLQGAIPNDTIAANVPRFNTDGTSNPAGTKIHVGWNWAIKAAIEARSACAVTYYNLGIGGTTSAATAPGGLYNGRHPDRLAAAYATGAKLAVIAFGMNELGGVATYGNIVAMIDAFRAQGIEPIIFTVPGTNSLNRMGASLRGAWETTNDALVRAALDTNTAYVPVHLVTGYGCEMALGISRESFSAANTINHDGPYVMKRLGQFAAAMLVD